MRPSRAVRLYRLVSGATMKTMPTMMENIPVHVTLLVVPLIRDATRPALTVAIPWIKAMIPIMMTMITPNRCGAIREPSPMMRRMTPTMALIFGRMGIDRVVSPNHVRALPTRMAKVPVAQAKTLIPACGQRATTMPTIVAITPVKVSHRELLEKTAATGLSLSKDPNPMKSECSVNERV